MRVGEDHRRAAFEIELFQTAAQCTRLRQHCECSFRRSLGPFAVAVRGRIFRLVLEQRQRAIAQDRIDPGTAVAACRIEAARQAPDAQKRLLHRFLGEVAAAQDAKCNAGHAGGFHVKDQTQRCAVAAGATRQGSGQLRIVRPIVHRHPEPVSVDPS
jgi:hypothetical protein